MARRDIDNSLLDFRKRMENKAKTLPPKEPTFQELLQKNQQGKIVKR